MFLLNKRVYILCVCAHTHISKQCACVDTCHSTPVEIRGQLCQVGSLLPPSCGFGERTQVATFAMKVSVTTDSFHWLPFCIFSFYSK